MNPIQAPAIPESHAAFATAVAALADAHKIERFQLTYSPGWEGRHEMQRGQHIRGDLRIDYRSTDGRGRPAKNLAITLDAVLTHQLVAEPESSN